MIESFWEKNRTQITRQFLGNYQRMHWVGHELHIHDLNHAIGISARGDYLIRVRVAPGAHFLPEFSYALSPDTPAYSELILEENADAIWISTRALRLKVEKEGLKVSLYDIHYQLLNEDASGPSWEENQEFGGYYVYSQKKAKTNEAFYGLGDKACDLLLNGKRFTLWSTDSYAFERNTDPLYRNVPFYMGLSSGMAYGLFYDNTYRTHFDFCLNTPDEVGYVAEGGELQYYYIAGPSLKDVVQHYAELTGTHAMPPLWGLGFHQSRWSYFPESNVLELAKTFREKQIPCDVIHLDIDHMDGYKCFTWNPEHFPQASSMIKQLHEMGFKVVVIVDPGIKIDPNYPIYQEGKTAGYFCRRGDDYYMEGPVWPGRCQFPDFTNPKVRKWWGQQFKFYLDSGVDGFWTDMNEPSVFGMGTFPNDVRHYYEGYRGSHRKAHNIYGMQMARASRTGVKNLNPSKRPMMLTRSSYSGAQRYAAFWTGDNIGSWDHLKLACLQCQRMSISGMSFVGSDIGGFTANADAELFTRWIQLGTFTPFMRAHSSGDTREREPWSYGPETEAIIKFFLEWRYRLLPYLYTVFWEHHRYGLPMLRPLVMLAQEEESAWWRQDEYGYGDQLMVCPVMEPGATGRTVYLPEGPWYHLFTRKSYPGKQEHYIEADLSSMPVFVRGGAIMPEYPVVQHTGELKLNQLILNAYYAPTNEVSTLYEDHGETQAYEQGIYTEKRFTLIGKPQQLSITQTMEGMYTPPYDTYQWRMHGLPFRPINIIVDGMPVNDFFVLDETEQPILYFKTLKSFSHIVIDA